MNIIANFTSEERLLLPRMAHDFYGYGDFSRPYWFVGTEPGGGSLEELRRKLHAWQQLGCNEVVSALDASLVWSLIKMPVGSMNVVCQNVTIMVTF